MTSTIKDDRPVFFFDIDNCLYSRNNGVHHHMARLINEYFVKHLELSTEDAWYLHQKYYKDYGLAIEGLARHHKIAPLDFNREVDDAIPLDDILFPDRKLRNLLEQFDPRKVKLWLFTNAYVTHGQRVVKLLGVGDLFEGMTYCDYGAVPLVPKPLPEMFEKAEREAGVSKAEQCYFVDDSHLNCEAAEARGWNAVHLVEPSLPDPEAKACKHQINSLSALLDLFPQLLKSPNHANANGHAS